MTHGKFPDVRQGDRFCTRCTGRLVTKQEGNYKFFLASDDGSLMYLNGEKVVDNNGCHGETEKGSGDKFLKPGAHEIVVDMCEMGGGEVFKMRWKGPDSGNSKVKIPAAVLKHDKDVPVDQYGTIDVQGKTYNKFWWFTKGSSWPAGKADVLGDSFGTCDDGDKVCFQRLPKVEEKDLELLAVDDVGNQFRWKFDASNSVAHAAFEAFRHGKTTQKTQGPAWAPEVLKGSVTSGAQDTLMYRDQDGVRSFMLDDDACDCHSTLSMGHAMCGSGCNQQYGNCQIKGGVDKLSDRSETGGEGSGSSCTGPATDHGLTLYFREGGADDEEEQVDMNEGLECTYYYDQSQCRVPDLEALTPSNRVVLPEIFMENGKFPEVRQGNHFCIRCTGHLVTKKEGNYKFFLSSDDGSVMYLNDEKVVDNDDCHGERERGSDQKYLKKGKHKLAVNMCEMGGGEVLKMHYKGPDTGNSKVKIPKSVLRHDKPKDVDLEDGLECDYFYDQSQCQVPDLGTLSPAHRVIVPEIYMGDQFCTRCTGRLVTKKEGNYKFFLASDDGSLMYLNGKKVVDNNGCHGEQERGSDKVNLKPGAHEIVVDMCERGGGEVFKMRWKGPDSGNSKVKIPATALKHEKPKLDLEDGLRCDYFYDKSQCRVPDLGALSPAHTVIVPEIYMTNGKFPDVRQGDQFCTRCTGRLVTKKEGNYKFFLASDDGSLMYLNGEKIVDNDDCHGERERGSGDKFLKPGAHEIVVDMCERGGGEVFKMRWKGPDSGNSKVKIPATALKHEKAVVKAGPALLTRDLLAEVAFSTILSCAYLALLVLCPCDQTNGNFPDVKQGNQFCVRCTGQLVTKKEGNYKFFTVSDDGSLMYLNGEKIVDNNGCHGSRERGSGDKFLKPGTHDIMVDMCERGGGEVFKMRWKGPDSDNSKVKIPARALQHVEISLKPPLVLSHKAAFECGKCQLSSEGSGAALPTGGPFTFFAEVNPKGQAGKHPGILGWGSSGDNFVALRMFPGHNNGGLHLYWKANGQFKEVAVESAGLLNDGWKTVAASWDKSTIKLYANGQLLKSSGYSGAFNAADKSGFCACVGEPGRTHEALGGKMRNVQIMNKALSDAEIAKLPLEPPLQLGAGPLPSCTCNVGPGSSSLPCVGGAPQNFHPAACHSQALNTPNRICEPDVVHRFAKA
ncbi:rsgI3 [Symbiodinium microadriaticum]|nr:rsgI3 [Symbiodinium microadriaticum]